MTGQLRTPRRRACEICGRRERWDEQAETWRIHETGGAKHAGDPFCIHEWDINGSFNPFEG